MAFICWLCVSAVFVLHCAAARRCNRGFITAFEKKNKVMIIKRRAKEERLRVYDLWHLSTFFFSFAFSSFNLFSRDLAAAAAAALR